MRSRSLIARVHPTTASMEIWRSRPRNTDLTQIMPLPMRKLQTTGVQCMKNHSTRVDTNSTQSWNGQRQRRSESEKRFDTPRSLPSDELKLTTLQIDLRIITWAWMMFMALDLNRRNINRAISDTLLKDLGMNTNDFNYGQTIFLISFLSAELPSGLISKKVGPDRWIPFIIVAWSIISAAQAGLSNKTGYYVCRCLLGLLMGGFIVSYTLLQTICFI